MPGMHLKQPAFTDSACEPFTKNKERIQNLKKQDTSYIYKNELDEPCFQHAYGVFKDLARITASDTTFNIAKNLKYDGYQRGLASMVYKFFDKNSKESSVNIEIKPSEQLAEKLHKPIIRNLKKEQFIQDLKTIFGELI